MVSTSYIKPPKILRLLILHLKPHSNHLGEILKLVLETRGPSGFSKTPIFSMENLFYITFCNDFINRHLITAPLSMKV